MRYCILFSCFLLAGNALAAPPDSWKTYHSPEMGFTIDCPYTVLFDKPVESKETQGQRITAAHAMHFNFDWKGLIKNIFLKFLGQVGKEPTGFFQFNAWDFQLTNKGYHYELKKAVNRHHQDFLKSSEKVGDEHPQYKEEPVTVSGMPGKLLTGSYEKHERLSGRVFHYETRYLIVTYRNQMWDVLMTGFNEENFGTTTDKMIKSIKIEAQP